MSTKKKLLEAAAGAASGAATYVDDVFSTYLYDGTGSAQTITNGIDLDGEGGLVWIKDRSASGQYNSLYDTERGANEVVRSDQTWAASSANGGVSAFNNNGFSIDTYDDVSRSGSNFASWTFRKQPGFFDVVTYTGDGTSNRNISHNLGSVPGCIIIKNLSINAAWVVYHHSLSSASYYLELNSTAAQALDSDQFSATAPTDSVFTVGPNSGVNRSGDSFVAYLFAHDAQDFGTDSDESIIKCGSYTGNGSADGPEIDLGWEPQWLIVKAIDGSDNWYLQDTMRGMVTDGDTGFFFVNASSGEAQGGGNRLDVTSTGFKIKTTAGSFNDNARDYIYVAIRRPHKPASEFAATDLFAIDELSVSTTPNFESGFPVDFAINRQPVGGTSNWNVGARLIQGRRLFTNLTDAESAESNNQFDYQDGYGGANLTNYLGYMFRRAPGFFDVVTYTGNGVNPHAISHNLGVAPEMIIVKRRNSTGNWRAYTDTTGVDKFLILNSTAGSTSGGSYFVSAPTDSLFTLGNSNDVNASGGTYISYLFASTSGISKVGTYSGTGSNVDVDCGFTSGARFVLVKRTDSTGDWYLWDSERGIVAGNDPYLFLNTTAAEATSTDYIDPLSSGFTITSSAPAALNASGGNYIFYAIA